MAAAAASLTEELICSICMDIFRDPVMLDCGHNYCKDCILKFWEDRVQNVSCPECRHVFFQKSFKGNRALANLAEKARDLSLTLPLAPAPVPASTSTPAPTRIKNVPKQNCKDHPTLPVEFFCDTDKGLLCRTCSTSWKHKNHRLLTIRPAVQRHKAKLKTLLQNLRETKACLSDMQRSQERKIKKIKNHSTSLIQQAESQFAQLYQFLADREQQLKREVKKQEEKAQAPIKETIQKIQEEVKSIEKEIRAMQSLIDQENDLTFLKSLVEVPDSIHAEPEIFETEPKLPSLGVYEEFLQFVVWRGMEKIVNPVPKLLTVQCANARSMFITSPDQSRSTDVSRQTWHDHRYHEKCWTTFNGSSNRFCSGKHYWEVEVGEKSEWVVGVSVYPGDKVTPDLSLWDKVKTFVNTFIDRKFSLMLRMDGKYFISTPTSTTNISLNVKPKRIGLFLDYGAGQVSFYNTEDMSLIAMVSDRFNGEVYAHLNPGNDLFGQNSEPLNVPIVTMQFHPSRPSSK